MIDLIVACGFGVSLSLNIALLLYLFKFSKKKGQATYDVQALLRDMASGPALVKIEYIDRSDILLRSPRHL